VVHFRRSGRLLGLAFVFVAVWMVNGGSALGAEPRHYYCITDPLTFVLATDSWYPEALKHHDISGRLRVFLKPDKSMDHFTFE
jgi:hypothetical protein